VKKKSPPYAIIGAIVLFLVAFYVYHQIQLRQQAEADAKVKAAQDAANQAILDAQKGQQAQVTVTATNMRGVLYATQAVEPGQRISAPFYETKPTPTDILPDAYTDKDDIVGWFATRKIEKGDPLTPRNIGKSLPYMSQRISPGMRAIAIPIFTPADVNQTGGFVVDGDRVDLLFTRWFPSGEQFLDNTSLVMQNLQVLYVPGPQIKTEKTDGVNPVGIQLITFEVTPEQAEALLYMSHIKNGNFSMILRARADDTEIKIKPFATVDYQGDYHNVQTKVVDRSMARVKELSNEIEAKLKAESQGTTNETTPPTPPTP
jgi:Flp pilus assembly protein CpaB